MDTNILIMTLSGIYIGGMISYVLIDKASNKKRIKYYNLKSQYKKFKIINKEIGKEEWTLKK